MEFGHVLEVHTPHTGQKGGRGDVRGPPGHCPHVVVLADRDHREVGFECRFERLAGSVDAPGEADRVVEISTLGGLTGCRSCSLL